MNDSAVTADVLDYLNHAPTSEFNGQGVELVDTWEGTDNLLWRINAQVTGRDAVLKLYLDAGQARCRRQFDGHQMFTHLGIAPQPLWYDRYPQGLARQILVYEWAPGQLLDAADSTQIVALARAVAQVHHGDLDQMRRFSPNPLNLQTLWRIVEGSVRRSGAWLTLHSQTLSELFQQIAAAAQELVEFSLPLWLGALPAPVHGDLKLENCLLGAGSVVLLDWEMFGLGDPALDAASFVYWNRLALAGEADGIWLDTYLSQQAHIHLAARINVYARILPFQTLCYLLDGLRNLSAGQDGATLQEKARVKESADFLRGTLHASLAEAAIALDVGADDWAADVQALFDIL